MSKYRLRWWMASIAFLLMGFAWQVQATTVTVIYNFTGGSDGSYPCSGLTPDSSGALYGFTMDGKLFRLSPSGGGWSFSVLYQLPYLFNHGYCVPPAIDSAGAVYGVMQPGLRSASIVFQLTSPSGGGTPWNFRLLRRLQETYGGAAGYPTSLVWSESAGALFGATAFGGDRNCSAGSSTGCGMVYKLSPNGLATGPWVEQILHRFYGHPAKAPLGPIAIRSDGAIFGVTGGNGESGQHANGLFELIPPISGTAWQVKKLHELPSRYGGIYDLNGILFDRNERSLYVTALAGGRFSFAEGAGGAFGVFSPAASGDSGWSLVVRHYFGARGPHQVVEPTGYLALDSKGAVFGTIPSNGTGAAGGGIFKMTPPAVGETAWRYNLYAPGTFAMGALVIGSDDTIYAVDSYGGSHGTIFKVTP